MYVTTLLVLFPKKIGIIDDLNSDVYTKIELNTKKITYMLVPGRGGHFE